jgi:hypothetical protein
VCYGGACSVIEF